jgi:CRISPR-associated protein Csh2
MTQEIEPVTQETLKSRREILFLYDIRMGNPNGDPDENRPRRLPDGRFYVTDVRLKRFVRDYVASQGKEILVGNIEGKTTNLTGRVSAHLTQINEPEANGADLVKILLDAFIDARWFGSSLAFKESDGDKKRKWNTVPKTLTGAMQFNMGEVLNRAEEIQINGTTTFASSEDKTTGTFTETNVLRYGLIAFSGVANEHSAKLSRMTEADYDLLLKALWNGVRSAANTRSKVGQVPRLLISLEYQEGEEFQFGHLMDYVQLHPANEKEENAWASPFDYLLDLSRLLARLEGQKNRIAKVRYEQSPDIQLKVEHPNDWEALGFDTPA